MWKALVSAERAVHRPPVDEVLSQRLRHHPAIFLVGPRATGKTTTAARLARTVLALDRPPEAAVVRADPDAGPRTFRLDNMVVAAPIASLWS